MALKCISLVTEACAVKFLSCDLSVLDQNRYLVLETLTYDRSPVLIMSSVSGRFLRGKIKQATLTWTPLWLAVRVYLGPLGKGTHFLTWDLFFFFTVDT